jgi:long-chain fatty acid transport protein
MLRTISVSALACLAFCPLAAADGLLLDQTARATGVAGACIAQVDDPTAVFYNPGALGLLKKKKGVSAGVTTTSLRPFQFEGRGSIGEVKTSNEILPAAFLTLPFPLLPKSTFGLGAFYSMHAGSDWQSPESFAGRYTATRSNIETYDVAPTVGMELTPTLGIGLGAVYRTGKIALERRRGAELNSVMRDIASESLETDTQSTLGWTAGLLLRPSTRFSFGASYRSPMTMEFEGAGTLEQIETGNAQLDASTKASFPFDQSLAILTQLRTPAQFNAGIAYGDGVRLEVDVNRAQWHSLHAITFAYPGHPTLDTTIPLDLANTTSYRAGVRLQVPTGPVVRVGYAIDNSPQPDATITPFLAMLDRKTLTLGAGLDWLDVAIAWSRLGERRVAAGNYSGQEWTVVITATK